MFVLLRKKPKLLAKGDRINWISLGMLFPVLTIIIKNVNNKLVISALVTNQIGICSHVGHSSFFLAIFISLRSIQ